MFNLYYKFIPKINKNNYFADTLPTQAKVIHNILIYYPTSTKLSIM